MVQQKKTHLTKGERTEWSAKFLIIFGILSFLLLFYISQCPPEIIEEDVETDRYLDSMFRELKTQEETLYQYYEMALSQCLEDINCTEEEKRIVEELIEQSLTTQEIINGAIE